MTDPAYEKIKRLVDTLYDYTRNNRLKWNIAFDDDALETNVGRNSLKLMQRWDPEAQEQDTVIFVRDIAGTTIDTIDGGVLNNVATGMPEFKNYWAVLTSLWTLANRQAHGADETIDDILEELKRK